MHDNPLEATAEGADCVDSLRQFLALSDCSRLARACLMGVFMVVSCGRQPGFLAALELVAVERSTSFQAGVSLWRDFIINPPFCMSSAPPLLLGTVARCGTTDFLKR